MADPALAHVEPGAASRGTVGRQERAIYPVLFRIGELEVTSFGVLVAIAALVGIWLFQRELRRSGLPDSAVDTGMAGGRVAGFVLLRRRRLPIVAVLAAATPALAVGHAIGRVGCFLVGDDYGLPSTLPWAVAFPEGLPPTTVPVHPTQLYEVAALLLTTGLLLRWRRAHRPDRFVSGAYLAATGSARFAIEFWRVRESWFGPLARE